MLKRLFQLVLMLRQLREALGDQWHIRTVIRAACVQNEQCAVCSCITCGVDGARKWVHS